METFIHTPSGELVPDNPWQAGRQVKRNERGIREGFTKFRGYETATVHSDKICKERREDIEGYRDLVCVDTPNGCSHVYKHTLEFID